MKWQCDAARGITLGPPCVSTPLAWATVAACAIPHLSDWPPGLVQGQVAMVRSSGAGGGGGVAGGLAALEAAAQSGASE